MNKYLQKKVAKYNSNYERYTHITPKHFVCPILHDDNDCIMKGHVINDALKVSNKWVPQREGLDSFYGLPESILINSIELEKKTPIQMLFEKRSHGYEQTLSTADGTKIDYYVPNEDVTNIPENHTLYESESGPIVLKGEIDPKILEQGLRLELIGLPVNLGDPIFVPVLLKMAYLSIFYLFGYSNINTASDNCIRNILSEFYMNCKDVPKHKRRKRCFDYARERYSEGYDYVGSCLYFGQALVEYSYFNDNLKTANVNFELYRHSTVDSGIFLAHYDTSDKIFAISVIVVLHDKENNEVSFLVKLPAGNVIAYLKNISDPAPFTTVSICEWKPVGTEKHMEPHIVVSERRFRMYLNQNEKDMI